MLKKIFEFLHIYTSRPSSFLRSRFSKINSIYSYVKKKSKPHCGHTILPRNMIWTKIIIHYLNLLWYKFSFFWGGGGGGCQTSSKKSIIKYFLYLFQCIISNHFCGLTLPLGIMIWTNLNRCYLRMLPHKLQHFGHMVLKIFKCQHSKRKSPLDRGRH